MKAITVDRYGPAGALEVSDIEKPAVGDDDVLVRVRAACVNPADWHVVTGLPYMARAQMGLRKPKVRVLGADFAGQIEVIGSRITQFHPGDEVFGEADGGGLAEYISVSQDSLVRKPANLTFEQSAAVPMAGLTALQGLRDKGQIESGQQVLINGASGGVGTFAVQIAKSFGAEVTGVCSATNVEMVRSIGADHVIDYTSEDFTRGGRLYDLILDNVGNRTLSANRRVLTPRGIYVSSFGRPHRRWVGPLPFLLKMFAVSPFTKQKLVVWVAKRKKEDLLTLAKLLEDETVAPVIDRTYPLSEVSQAMQYLEEGHAKGKVVVTV